MTNKETKQIIPSVLWTDLYKLTMGQAVLHNYVDLKAEYQFINRGRTAFPEGFAGKLRSQVEQMSKLRLSDWEAEKLHQKVPELSADYLDFLSRYRFDPSEVVIDQSGGELSVGINGLWKNSIYWVVPLMTTISELYYKETGQEPEANYRERAFQKGNILRENDVKTVDFGTRRSFSTEVHEQVLEALLQSRGVIGTSNVALALKHDISAVGTYAHEWVQAHLALFGAQAANVKSMEVWNHEYQGKFGIALTDTLTTDVFLRTFDRHWAEIFDGVRQDSGNPFEIGDRLVNHYKSIGIDAASKRLVFSDSLNTEKAVALNAYFKNRIQPLFGIGTNFTNDVGVKPLNMVVKLFSIGFPDGRKESVVKFSDDKGKESGDPTKIIQIRKELQRA